MKPVITKAVLAMALAACVPSVAQAGPHADELGKCLVTASSEKDKQVLVRWIFFAMAQHPDVAQYADVGPAQREDADRSIASLFERLLGESCLAEAREAVKHERTTAFTQSFQLLGQIAGQGIFTDPMVSAGADKFTAYIDTEKLAKLLEIQPDQ